VDLFIFIFASISIAVLHTLVPDHYLPIALLAQAQNWSLRKTALITGLAGMGHVATSIVIGILAMGISMQFSENLASKAELLTKGMLISFGLLYTLYAVKSGGHLHYHHSHGASDVHEHKKKNGIGVTGYTMALIVGLMPCVPAIPIFISASLKSTYYAALSMVAFAIFTLLTMYIMVLVSIAPKKYGLMPPIIRRNMDIISGIIIFLTGIIITIFDLRNKKSPKRFLVDKTEAYV
jgi:sulfite exporter TauE/SafE